MKPPKRVWETLFCCWRQRSSSISSRRSKTIQNGGNVDGLQTQTIGQATGLTASGGRYLLNTLRHSDMHKKCMVIDLDETLVHSSFKVTTACLFHVIRSFNITKIFFLAYTKRRFCCSSRNWWNCPPSLRFETSLCRWVFKGDGRTLRVRLVHGVASKIRRSSRWSSWPVSFSVFSEFCAINDVIFFKVERFSSTSFSRILRISWRKLRKRFEQTRAWPSEDSNRWQFSSKLYLSSRECGIFFIIERFIPMCQHSIFFPF